MSGDVVFLIGGLALMFAVGLPSLLERAWLSAPVILIALGALIGLLPLPQAFVMDPVDQQTTILHVTEITVLLALMGVGLALDRPLSLRRITGWRTWSATWKLLGIAMPLTIGGVFLLGWWGLGLAAAPALLLGAALAPTDPVLASDVQVGGPGEDLDTDDEEISERDEVRFALTSEAGLNDGLAFPFVYAAIFLASMGAVSEWGARWLAWELVGKVVLGLIVGVGIGTVLGWAAFRSERKSLRLAARGEPLLALAAMLLSFGATELVGGYGFLGVFACAMALRAVDRTHRFHEHMHGVIERLERMMTLFVLLFVGISITDGTLTHLDWRGVVLAAALVFGIRPLAGWLALGVGRWRMADESHRPLERRERAITSFFGIRGVGTIYYLAYALSETSFPEERWLWATALFAIILSVVVHGVLATPVMAKLEARREQLTGAA
ncbi:MAG: cation:proton antiporter [Actinomycetales bacterium]|nr:cation:proton antiporter [Actinomycetales bacterium]